MSDCDCAACSGFMPGLMCKLGFERGRPLDPQEQFEAVRAMREACVELPHCVDPGFLSHDPVCPSIRVAMDLVVKDIWEFLNECDHGSHHYCYPCMAYDWPIKNLDTMCARCGNDLGNTFVGDGEGTCWHIDCAPIHIIMDIDGDHHP